MITNQCKSSMWSQTSISCSYRPTVDLKHQYPHAPCWGDGPSTGCYCLHSYLRGCLNGGAGKTCDLRVKSVCVQGKAFLLTLGSILVFFRLRHFSTHRSQFGCVNPDLDKNRYPFNCGLSSMKSLAKVPGPEIRALRRDKDSWSHKTAAFWSWSRATGRHNGPWATWERVYQLDINGDMQLLMLTEHISTGHDKETQKALVNTEIWHVCLPSVLRVKHTLSPPRFLLHQCTLMKENAPTMNLVMLHTQKNHDLLLLLWQRRGAKSWKGRAGFFFHWCPISIKKKEIEVNTLIRPVFTQTPGEMPSSGARAISFSSFWWAVLLLNARQAGSTG